MAEAQALVPAQGPDEAPLDASAIHSRVEQLSLKRLEVEPEAEVAEDEVALGLDSTHKAAQDAMDEWDSATAAVSIDDLDAYLEQLRKDVAMAEQGNQKVSGEISVTAETTFNDMIQLDVGIEMLESLISNLGPKALNHFDESSVLGLSDSTDSCRNRSIADKDYIYELELDHQIEKSTMELEILQHLQRDDEMFQLESKLLPFGAKILDFKDDCLRMFLKAPILTSDCEIYGQKFNCSIDSFISDHELLIEIDKINMEPKKVQIIPDDMSVDILIERMESSRDTVCSPTLIWLIQQCQHQSIINALRRSLVNDANSSRHCFEYLNKKEMIVAHLDRGIDVSIKMSSDWPLCSYGLKLISIRNAGDRPTNIASTILCKTKELANELEPQIRQHLLTLVDAVEDIIIRELRSR
ncbi:uncharacterized protein LOC100381501 [Zea mays]|uniref:Uncharacterized protein n=4 Tax=Zea mays TaxID=4577 RepID=C0HGG6_MAIZE|nr:uncharacterized protein LOC100381501 [Zea mays]ACN26119.1 unknown [Zea mays]ONM18184.1 hypothetical protein ZEAMMB73_Zm00001d004020 [Zea mays]|eukprot:NP_001167803.1 uncharacterized protein LOC100381501 [Zea mays]